MTLTTNAIPHAVLFASAEDIHLCQVYINKELALYYGKLCYGAILLNLDGMVNISASLSGLIITDI
jgi:hypothetical protein